MKNHNQEREKGGQEPQPLRNNQEETIQFQKALTPENNTILVLEGTQIFGQIKHASACLSLSPRISIFEIEATERR